MISSQKYSEIEQWKRLLWTTHFFSRFSFSSSGSTRSSWSLKNTKQNQVQSRRKNHQETQIWELLLGGICVSQCINYGDQNIWSSENFDDLLNLASVILPSQTTRISYLLIKLTKRNPYKHRIGQDLPGQLLRPEA